MVAFSVSVPKPQTKWLEYIYILYKKKVEKRERVQQENHQNGLTVIRNWIDKKREREQKGIQTVCAGYVKLSTRFSRYT